MALSIQPYKGARDFYPEDKALQKYLFATWREVCESYGYEEYDAPILEPLDIYLAKTGDEIVNEQTYVFEDRSGRKVVIRPEMTPTVSRMVAGKRQQLAYPLRWYSIPNLWRYERPQRGRLREHWQLNVDVFGIDNQSAEIEIISVVSDIFKAFGARDEMYKIKLNHRGLINYILSTHLGLKSEAQHKVSKLIDRMSKMPQAKFISDLDEVLTAKQKQDGLTEKVLNILAAKKPQDLPSEVQKHPDFMELKEVLTKLQTAGIKNAIFDITLMRGFDYYTGIVFEADDTDPENNRSMMGGGRYDGLVGLFGVDPVPTVGFGWGDVALINFLESHHLMPNLKPTTNISVVLAGDVSQQAGKILSELRNSGLNVAVDSSGRKLGDQLKNASKRNVNHVIIIGDKEIKSGKVTLRNLSTSKEQTLSVAQVIKQLSVD